MTNDETMTKPRKGGFANRVLRGLYAAKSEARRRRAAFDIRHLIIPSTFVIRISSLENQQSANQVSPFDMSIFLIVPIILAAVGLLASYIPAVRAARADPVVALGHDV
jgi:hypothetical protein